MSLLLRLWGRYFPSRAWAPVRRGSGRSLRNSLRALALLTLLASAAPAAEAPATETPPVTETPEAENIPPSDPPAAGEAAAETLAAESLPLSKADLQDQTVEQLAKIARDSIVVIRITGRDGKEGGLGTGFVVSADGLIATNLHVIGEARPITVQLADGRRYDVKSVHASDRSLDLALVKIDVENLPPLELGAPDSLVDGQAVVALGNPQGLEHSVVSGVVSGQREIEGRPMIQVAIPIEPGNSGGPLLDMQGRVHGILTMKSLVTPNLGFAVRVASLRTLLEHPNPIAIERWLTIGALDSRLWTTVGGARWRQRAGRISVDGAGVGFGGRALCLWAPGAPPLPLEAGVHVKLDDEAGAAGLVFHADGGDKHYGFYPSNGKLRLVRFDGADVYSWNILAEIESPHYRPREWNHLKVRLEPGKLTCYVNDQAVIESADNRYASGKMGLAKFRQTQAEFKGFQLGAKLGPATPPADMTVHVASLVAEIDPYLPPAAELVEILLPDAPLSGEALRRRAHLLEQQAAQLRKLAGAVHHERVLDELRLSLAGAEEQIDLFYAALLVAWLDNEEIDLAAYRAELDRLAAELTAAIPEGAKDSVKVAALNKLLFTDLGFHGGRGEYYSPSNSYMNEVLDDREGLPITLGVLYLELGRRAGLNLEGVGLPGHFVVRHLPPRGHAQLIDVYERGKSMTRAEASKWVREMTAETLKDEHFLAIGKRQIVFRMLHNLLGNATRQQDFEASLRYLDGLLVIQPDAHQERWFRAVARYRAGRHDDALADARHLIAQQPAGFDLAPVKDLLQMLEQAAP